LKIHSGNTNQVFVVKEDVTRLPRLIVNSITIYKDLQNIKEGKYVMPASQ